MLKYSINDWALNIQPQLQKAGCLPLNRIPGYRDSGIIYSNGSIRPGGFYIDFVDTEHETMFIMRFAK